jgi:RimJ/RimL family protein N-acetyltransferase
LDTVSATTAPHRPSGAGGSRNSVHRLEPEQRELIASHFLRLDADDRRLRFGIRTDDAAIERYVARLDFSRDPMFGVFAPQGTLIALAHLALDVGRRCAEVGLSVEPAYRNRGHGHALLTRAMQHAADAGYRTLVMHCLAENESVKRLARRSGLVVLAANGEANARIELKRNDDASAAADRPLLRHLAVQ